MNTRSNVSTCLCSKVAPCLGSLLPRRAREAKRRFSPTMLRPGIVGMRGSMIIRPRSCMTSIRPPPQRSGGCVRRAAVESGRKVGVLLPRTLVRCERDIFLSAGGIPLEGLQTRISNKSIWRNPDLSSFESTVNKACVHKGRQADGSRHARALPSGAP